MGSTSAALAAGYSPKIMPIATADKKRQYMLKAVINRFHACKQCNQDRDKDTHAETHNTPTVERTTVSIRN